jgi:hypothetical protein
MARMQILSTVEHDAFESPPVFSSVQRKHHLDFSRTVQELAATLRTPTNQLAFLLGWGYFTATKRFFPVSTFRPQDVAYVATHLRRAPETFDLGGYDQQIVARHRELILHGTGFRAFDLGAQTFLEREIRGMVRAQLKPRLIFGRCVDLLIREKVEVPTYFRLADLILTALNHHKQELLTVLEHTLPAQTRPLLDGLFVQSPTLDGGPVDSPTTASKLTLLKQLSQSTRPIPRSGNGSPIWGSSRTSISSSSPSSRPSPCRPRAFVTTPIA